MLGVRPASEWRKDRPLPISLGVPVAQWAQYYLDYFDAPEAASSQEAGPLVDTLSDTMLQQLVAYANVGAEVATDKLVLRETQVARMGAFVDGEWGRVSDALPMIWCAMHFALWLLSQRVVYPRTMLMLLGRLVRCFEFRRPLLGLLPC